MTEAYAGPTQDLEIRKDPGKPEPARHLNTLERREALACSPDELVGTTWELERGLEV